jgi:hypothetical protein
MKLASRWPVGSIFIARRPSVKSTCTLWAPFARQRRISFSCSPSRSSMNWSRVYPGIPSEGYMSDSAEGEITACFTGTFA